LAIRSSGEPSLTSRPNPLVSREKSPGKRPTESTGRRTDRSERSLRRGRPAAATPDEPRPLASNDPNDRSVSGNQVAPRRTNPPSSPRMNPGSSLRTNPGSWRRANPILPAQSEPNSPGAERTQFSSRRTILTIVATPRGGPDTVRGVRVPKAEQAWGARALPSDDARSGASGRCATRTRTASGPLSGASRSFR
jgi:hypothetical protein